MGAQGGTVEEVCKVAFRNDGKGLLVSVSRGISDPSLHVDGKGMAELAAELRDAINCRRGEIRSVSSFATAKTSSSLQEYQSDFIKLAINNNVLRFGSFTLKSGRVSPYFFNAGHFAGGQSMSLLCR